MEKLQCVSASFGKRAARNRPQLEGIRGWRFAESHHTATFAQLANSHTLLLF